MDTTKIEDRLKLYELALADYEKSLGGDKRKYKTHSGFCAYFLFTDHIDIYGRIDLIFPELYAQKPKNGKVIWFDYGEIQPRIECLKKAIELTKSKMNQ